MHLEMQYKEERLLPMNPRYVKQSADATIKSLIDAIVELVTNSDDSYRRLEENGVKANGKIELFVTRKKGGICESFMVKDYAEGMSKKKLEKAVEFAGETSGFKAGRTVRGLFGRGLKESIIALGEGEIYTIKDNTLNVAKIRWDDTENKPKWCPSEEIQNIPPELRNTIGIENGNGTLVKIKVKNDKIKAPECDKLKEQIASHYALREIMISDNREILLSFEGYEKRKHIKRSNIEIKYKIPIGSLVYDSYVKVPRYSDTLEMKIFESSEQLDSPHLNPFAKSGIIIKTEVSCLDNSLFKYNNDPAAFYFFGEAYCEGIAERIRQGETGIIDLNRGGVEWQNEYCKAIAEAIEEVLDPIVLQKKKTLEGGEERKEIAEPIKKMLRRLCNTLDALAKREFDEWQTPIEPADNIDDLTILPRYAYIEVDKPRAFGVYAPLELVRVAKDIVTLQSDNANIKLMSHYISLDQRSKKHPSLCYGIFRIIGQVNEEEANITCEINGHRALTHVKVHTLGNRGPKPPSGAKGGFIREIIPDLTPNPPQRVEYKEQTAEIRVYIKFPAIAKYLSEGFKGADTEQGRVMLAELVGEAFCRALAFKKLGSAEAPSIPGREIDSFISAVNDIQKKYLYQIHEIIAKWKFE
jgi:hypothetical protein